MVSIIIPYIRYDGMKKCINAINENAANIKYEIIAEEDKNRIGVPNMVINLVKQCNFDLIMFLADDTIPQERFLENSVNEMCKFEDGIGMVGLNDGIWGDQLSTHFLIHRKLVPLVGGYIFNPIYMHCFCDSELTLRAKELDKYRYCENAKIIHNHPMFNSNIEIDDDYKRVYKTNIYLKDKHTFIRRKERNWN